jgi:hypothetical protein
VQKCDFAPSCFGGFDMPQSYTKKKGSRVVPDPDKFLFNIDTFWYNIDAMNYDEVMDSGFREFLRSAREYYMDTDERKTLEVELPGYDHPVVFEVYPGQPPLYQYSIRNEDMAIYFSKSKRDDHMPMKVQLNQFILWEKGLQDAYIESLWVLAALGFEHGKGKLNRVDFAVHSDQWQWNFKDFEKFEYPRNLARDNFPNWWRLDPVTGNFQTVYFGDRTTCQLRIYQKSIESKKKGKDYFLELYESLGMDKDKVWNVEIEVRRDFIKECKDLDGLALFDDLDKVFEENRLSLLWSYLMKLYHHPSAFWTVLSSGKPGVFEKVKGYLKRQKDNDANAWRETAQIRGRLMTFLLNDSSLSIEDAIRKFLEKNREYEKVKDKDFSAELAKKKKMFHDPEINHTLTVIELNEEERRKQREEKIKRIKEKLLRERKIDQKEKKVKTKESVLNDALEYLENKMDVQDSERPKVKGKK